MKKNTKKQLRYTIIEKGNLYRIIDNKTNEQVGNGYTYVREAIVDCRILNGAK